jgi:hypothetical protein
MDWVAFLKVHEGLDREGPGLPEDVHWAQSRALTEAQNEIPYALMLVQPA